MQIYAGLHALTQLHDNAAHVNATTQVGGHPCPLMVLIPFVEKTYENASMPIGEGR